MTRVFELSLPILTTSRLEVRPVTMDDRAAVEPLWPNAQACREWADWQSRAYEQLDRLRMPPYGDRAVVLRKTATLVGLTGIVPSFDAFGRLPFFGGDADAPRSPEVGLFWALLPEHRGNGYATEAAQALVDFAFTTLDLGRIVATTARDNEASIAVMRRLGMHIEENPGDDPPSLQVVGVLVRPD